MPSESDEALALRAARGDADAFERIVLRHQDRLYTLALRITLSEADAVDCVQEALVSAWRALPRFRGDARLSTWLYRIVVRKAYDCLAARGRRALPGGAADELPLVAAGDESARAADRLDVVAALALLPPEFRAAAVACDVLGLSTDEAAEALGVPPGTVKSRLFRARARLADALRAAERGPA